jgi:hypothetical protein
LRGSDVQVELSTVLGFFGSLMGIVSLVIVTLARIAITAREKEIDRRIDDLTRKHDTMDLRLHTEEKATIRQDGDLKVVLNKHDGLQETLDDIKRQLERLVERFLSGEQQRPGRYGNPSGGYPQQRIERTDPPKKT